MNIATDFDGTLTTGAMGRAVGAYLSAHGRQAEYRRFFRRQLPRYLAARLGLLNMRRFKTGWAVEMPRLFAGMSEEQVREMLTVVVEEEMWANRRQDVIAELQDHQAGGARLLIVSGGYMPLLEAFAAHLDAEALGTPLEFVDGVATGALAADLNVGPRKAASVRAALGGEALDLAYGDTHEDLPMLEMAATAIAVYPSRRLQQVAQARGWRILAG